MQLIPCVQATQLPERHTRASPQAEPSETFPRAVHTGAPVEHSTSAVRQGFEAAHVSPWVQETQVPCALQTLPSPQELPAGRSPPVKQTGVPLEHDTAPCLHGSAGAHEAPSTHATQAPSEHTSFEPQAVPFGAFPKGTHAVTSPSQTIFPVRHGVLG